MDLVEAIQSEKASGTYFLLCAALSLRMFAYAKVRHIGGRLREVCHVSLFDSTQTTWA